MRIASYLLAAACFVSVASAEARPWKPTPQQQAQDYTSIVHNKGASAGTVRISWMAAPAFTGNMQLLMQKYLLLTLTHTIITPAGVTSYEDTGGVQVSDLAGQPLTEIALKDLPPALVGLTAQMDASFRQSVNGNAKMRILAFQPGTVLACQKGGLAVTYAGERYTFETPMPGCTE